MSKPNYQTHNYEGRIYCSLIYKDWHRRYVAKCSPKGGCDCREPSSTKATIGTAIPEHMQELWKRTAEGKDQHEVALLKIHS